MGYIPDAGAKRFRPVLGKYRKFLTEHPEVFTVVNSKDKANFIVKRAGDKAEAPKSPGMSPKPRFASSPKLSPRLAPSSPKVGATGSPKLVSKRDAIHAKKLKNQAKQKRRKAQSAAKADAGAETKKTK